MRSVENLLELYFQSVGRNGVLLLNLPVTPDGLVHKTDEERLLGFATAKSELFAQDQFQGAEVSVSSESVVGSGSSVLTKNPDEYWMAEEATESAFVELGFREARTISVISLEEAIARGQRIAAFQVEWKTLDGTWQTLCEGTTVGNKRLLRFDPIRCRGIRCRVKESYGAPALSGVRGY